MSGGVDSSVAAALIHRAIGDQLTCVFVDTGLLRLNEAAQVMDTFAKHLGVGCWPSTRATSFCGALAGVTDPEQKRKIIGREFIHVFQAEAAKLPNAKWLAQGTIYPDVIESAGGSKTAHTIKSHHNVGGLPDTLHLKLLEPLRELFKDEVRELGLALGLPRDMVFRHPFPGPGLGVRILGEVRREFADILRHADAIFIDELRKTACGAPAGEAATSRADDALRGTRELVRRGGAGVCRVSPGALGGRHGRRAHLRARHRVARGADDRLHDGALGAAAARAARHGVEPHHQRGAWHQSRGVRHLGQAAGDDRMGIAEGNGADA